MSPWLQVTGAKRLALTKLSAKQQEQLWLQVLFLELKLFEH